MKALDSRGGAASGFHLQLATRQVGAVFRAMEMEPAGGDVDDGPAVHLADRARSDGEVVATKFLVAHLDSRGGCTGNGCTSQGPVEQERITEATAKLALEPRNRIEVLGRSGFLVRLGRKALERVGGPVGKGDGQGEGQVG